MFKPVLYFWLMMVVAIIADQAVKIQILEGFRWSGECLSIILTYNTGVAFSMFSFLEEWLKWIQVGLIGGGITYVFYQGYLRRYGLPLGLLFGSGISNVYDRFIHGGVVDYVAWHCGFEFAVFNLADVLIDLAILWILILHFKK